MLLHAASILSVYVKLYIEFHNLLFLMKITIIDFKLNTNFFVYCSCTCPLIYCKTHLSSSQSLLIQSLLFVCALCHSTGCFLASNLCKIWTKSVQFIIVNIEILVG